MAAVRTDEPYDPEGPLFPAPDREALAEAARFEREIGRRERGEIDEEQFRRFRLQNGVYGIRGHTDVQMVRIKVPLGVLSAAQAERLADLARDFTRHGLGHLTTRQCVQFHWVPLRRVPELIRRLGEVGLTVREACGNTVRNVTVDPLAGVAPDEVFDVRPYAAAFVRHFLRNPATQWLPRKFKTSFSGSEADRAVSAMHDFGAVAALAEVNGRRLRGFRIYLGGGLGSQPRAGVLLEGFTAADQLLVTAEAVLRLFDRLGDRSDPHRARLKFLVASLGEAEFRRLVLRERRILAAVRPGDDALPPVLAREEDGARNPAAPRPPAAPPGAPPSFRRWLETNVVPQRQGGYCAAFVFVPGGDLTAEQFRLLARAAKRYADGKVRTTITQDVLFHWVREADLYDLWTELAEAGLGRPGYGQVADVVSCPGADTCNLAVTRSHRLALELTRRLLDHPEYGLADDLRGVAIKVSGCPNACGQHHVATIGLHGAARKVGERQVPYYQILLGGEAGPGRVAFGRPVLRVPARRVPEAVFRLFDLYREQRREGESFHDWVRRLEAEVPEGLAGDASRDAADEERRG